MNEGLYNGGPAFPTSTAGLGTGLNMRDWFAGMALQGILANPSDIQSDRIWDYLAEISYNYADAMLKEREKLNTTSPGDDPV